MAEDTGIGAISLFNTKSILWNLTFCLPSSKHLLRSPPFDFAGASWCFSLNPQEFPSSQNKYYFHILLQRLKSTRSCHEISYEVTLMKPEEDSQYPEVWNYCYSSPKKFDEYHVKRCLDLSHRQREKVALMPNHNSFQGGTSYSLEVFCILIDEGLKKEMPTLEESEENHESNMGAKLLSQDIKDVLLNGEDYNVTLNVKGVKFRAHQDILRARSQTFRSMLSRDVLEKNKGVIDMPDFDPQAFEAFLYYVYTGETKALKEKNMLALYDIADKYDMAHLKEECGEFIQKSLSVSNVCCIIQFALNHNDLSLLDSVTRFFTNNANEIIPTDEWQSFMKKNPTYVNELILKSISNLKDMRI